jgi:hypothetical protein
VDLVDIPARPEAPDRLAASSPGGCRDWGRLMGLQTRGHRHFPAAAARLFRLADDLVIGVTIPSAAAAYNAGRRSTTP